MRIRAAGRTEATHRGQWNGVRGERADVTNARRQSERHHKIARTWEPQAAAQDAWVPSAIQSHEDSFP